MWTCVCWLLPWQAFALRGAVTEPPRQRGGGHEQHAINDLLLQTRILLCERKPHQCDQHHQPDSQDWPDKAQRINDPLTGLRLNAPSDTHLDNRDIPPATELRRLHHDFLMVRIKAHRYVKFKLGSN